MTIARLEIDFKEEQERRQRRADRRAWLERLERIDRELKTEPARVEEGYTIKAKKTGAGGPRLSLAGDGVSAVARSFAGTPISNGWIMSSPRASSSRPR